MLGREEEKDLARRAEAGDIDAGRRLIASHLRVVIKIARAYRGFRPAHERPRAGGHARPHPRRAALQPGTRCALSTYAMWWIRAAIQDHVVHSWSLVRIGTTNAQKGLFLRLRRATADLLGGAEDLGDEITAKLAKSFGTTAPR